MLQCGCTGIIPKGVSMTIQYVSTKSFYWDNFIYVRALNQFQFFNQRFGKLEGKKDDVYQIILNSL